MNKPSSSFNKLTIIMQLMLLFSLGAVVILLLSLILAPILGNYYTEKRLEEYLVNTNQVVTFHSTDIPESPLFIFIYVSPTGTVTKSANAVDSNVISPTITNSIIDAYTNQNVGLRKSYDKVYQIKDETLDCSFSYIGKINSLNGTQICISSTALLDNYVSSGNVAMLFTGIAASFFVLFVIMIFWMKRISLSIINMDSFLKKYNTELTENTAHCSEMYELYNSFFTFKSSLLKADKQKQQLFQNISHELKTPITTIKLYADAIQDNILIESCKDNGDMAAIINREANNLLSKVEKIMIINRLSHKEQLNMQTLQKDRIIISDVLFDVLNTYNLRAPQIKFNVDLNPFSYRGTKEIWKSIFENVFDNNIRHHCKSITITLSERYLTIENDGDKIDDALLPKLFEPFVRGQGGNFGLGLSIIKQSLEMYGYSVRLSNTEHGTVMYSIIDSNPNFIY